MIYLSALHPLDVAVLEMIADYRYEQMEKNNRLPASLQARVSEAINSENLHDVLAALSLSIEEPVMEIDGRGCVLLDTMLAVEADPRLGDVWLRRISKKGL